MFQQEVNITQTQRVFLMSCPLCDEPKIDFYGILKKYCSNMKQIGKDLCDIHKQPFVEMGLEFTKK